MGIETKIEWADATFNAWQGCTKVSEACANCYAEVSTPARVMGVEWGPGKPRHRFKDWAKALVWNRQAEERGRKLLVFCNSLSDVFDPEVPMEWRYDLFELIRKTPFLIWMLLTKRPEFVREQVCQCMIMAFNEGNEPLARLLADWHLHEKAFQNVWLGTTVENQPRAVERIPVLQSLPAVVRFLSCEPLLGPLKISSMMGDIDLGPAVDWVICGGESGPGARPMRLGWAISLQAQCERLGIPFFFKQWGSHDHAGNPCDKAKAGRLLEGQVWDEFPDFRYSIRKVEPRG